MSFELLLPAALSVLAFYVLLYLKYQYRQSVFIGSSQAHFALFVLQLELARRWTTAPPRRRRAVLALLAVLVTLIAWTNLSRALAFVEAFSVPPAG